MLFITDNMLQVHEWHIGEPLPDIPYCRELQANSDELKLILITFHDIPRTVLRVQSWPGMWAQYIYRNLLLYRQSGQL